MSETERSLGVRRVEIVGSAGPALPFTWVFPSFVVARLERSV
jgi:hypothetical protein